MIDTVYVEDSVSDHPRVERLRQRFASARWIPCERYGQVFNRRSQDFRLQKRRPALILARKHDGHVLPTPPGYGIGTAHNYYFSHMLNCLYDCRYCFLQGMLPSANYIWFVNSEDFNVALDETVQRHATDAGGSSVTFFTGYDCDSLALESVTRFVEELLPIAERLGTALWEFRTKSVGIRPLLEREALSNVVVAFSLSPASVAKRFDHGAPSIDQRLHAMQRLAQRGWNLGLRFDPIIDHDGVEENYRHLFEQVFEKVPCERVHSVSLGGVRFPKKMHETIRRLHPEEALLVAGMQSGKDTVGYSDDREEELLRFCEDALQDRLAPETLFPCRRGGNPTADSIGNS